MRYYVKCKLNPQDRRKLGDSLKNGTLGSGTVFREGMQTALRKGTGDDDGDVVHSLKFAIALSMVCTPWPWNFRDKQILC